MHAAIQANIKSAQNGRDWKLRDQLGWTRHCQLHCSHVERGNWVRSGRLGGDPQFRPRYYNRPASRSYTTFSGQPVGPDDVLIKFTYIGDGNFDGQVDFDDYIAMDNTFFGLIPNFGWATGDINFDGEINFDDYTIVDQSYFFQGAPLSGGGGVNIAFASPECSRGQVVRGINFAIGWASMAVSKPHPSSVGAGAGLSSMGNAAVADRKSSPISATPLVESQ